MTRIKCMIDGCYRVDRFRGLCNGHYAKLLKRVNRGELTWEDAEKLGWCNPPKPKGEWMRLFSIGKGLLRRRDAKKREQGSQPVLVPEVQG